MAKLRKSSGQFRRGQHLSVLANVAGVRYRHGGRDMTSHAVNGLVLAAIPISRARIYQRAATREHLVHVRLISDQFWPETGAEVPAHIALCSLAGRQARPLPGRQSAVKDRNRLVTCPPEQPPEP